MPLGASRLAYLAKTAEAAAAGRTARSVFAVNNAQISTAQAQFGASSAYFDGDNDYLYVEGNSESVDFSGDFTLECWFRKDNTAGNTKIFDLRGINPVHTGGDTVKALGDTLLIDINGNDFRCFIDGADRSTSGGIISANVWYHLAVQRQSGTINAWIDGTRYVDYAGADDYTSIFEVNQPIGMGASSTALEQDWPGYIDEIRWSTVARYANGTSIAVPTQAFTNDDNTYMLLHCDGANGSTTFDDDTTPFSRTAKTLSAYGNAQISTAQSQFGGSSAYFDGDSDALKVTSGLTDFEGSGDFTYEFWINDAALSSGRIAVTDQRHTNNGAQTFNIFFWDGTLQLYQNGFYNFGGSFSNNTWTHIAVTKTGSTYEAFKDGSSLGTVTGAGTIGTVGEFNIALANDEVNFDGNGYIDEFRVSDNIRYTSNFTPPIAAFTNDPNTLLLIHADGANGSTTFEDDTTPPAAPTLETESLTSLSSVNWNRAQYYSYNMEYVGDDSSGNPVVAFAYVDDTANTNAYATLVRIDKSSLAITEGTPNNFYTGAGSGDPLEAPILCAEVGSNACAICYMDRNATGGYEVFGVAATLDLDNLTFSFGSSVTVENSSLDSFALNAHVGNGNYAMGNRSGGGVYHLMTRSGNTLSKTSTSTVNFGSGNVYNETEGFDNSGSLYRFTRLNSTGGVDISAGYFNGATGAQEASATPITGLSSVIISHHARLNTSNKGIAISSDNTTTKAAAYEITWPSSGTGAPSISTGTELTLSDDAYGDAYHVAESSTTDQAYYVYSDSGGNWNSRPITASGTALTEGSATSLSLLTSSQSSALDFIAFANSNGDEILVGIVDNTGSNAPDIYVRNLDV